MPKIDAPAVTSSTLETATERGKRWVEVPQKDLFDFPHPTIRINLLEFAPGRHYVDAEVADWIEELIRRRLNSDMRVMRPQQDVTSQNAMNRHGVGSRSGSFVTNPDTIG